jgi:hypothetical protein
VSTIKTQNNEHTWITEKSIKNYDSTHSKQKLTVEVDVVPGILVLILMISEADPLVGAHLLGDSCET